MYSYDLKWGRAEEKEDMLWFWRAHYGEQEGQTLHIELLVLTVGREEMGRMTDELEKRYLQDVGGRRKRRACCWVKTVSGDMWTGEDGLMERTRKASGQEDHISAVRGSAASQERPREGRVRGQVCFSNLLFTPPLLLWLVAKKRPLLITISSTQGYMLQ